MAKKAIMTFRTHYALALWNINIRREIENQSPIINAVTGEKASRRLFSLYIYARKNSNCSSTKRILAQKLLEKYEADILKVKEELLSIRKKTRQLIKQNTTGNFIIEDTIKYNVGKNPVQVKINADMTPHVASYARLYLILDDIIELVYKKRLIGLINYDQYRKEIEDISKNIKILMNDIINTTKKFFNIE